MKVSEVVGALSLLALVAVLVLPRMQQGNLRARRAKATSDIQALSAALDKYRVDNGSYPTEDQGLKALRQEPKAAPAPRHWAGPYLDRDVPLDPWGRPYVYLCPGKHNPHRFDLFTTGADGKDGGVGEDADVGNWE